MGRSLGGTGNAMSSNASRGKKKRNARHTQVQFDIGAAGRTDYYEASSRLAVPEGFDAGHWIRYSTL